MADIQNVVITPANAAQANINAMTAAANNVLAQADLFLEELLEVTNTQFADDGFNINGLLPNSYNYAQVPEVFTAIAQPAGRPLVTTAITAPVPVDSTFSTIADVAVPDLTAVAPTLNLPTTPSTTLPDVPTPVDFVSPDIPTAPTYTLPSIPTFADLALPSPPSINLPSFAASLPTDDLLVPTNTFAFYEELYASSILDEVKAKLLDDLQNGGYGIEPLDEDALWERLREREAEAAQVQIDEAYRTSAARGFPLPPGEVTLAVERAQQSYQNKVSSANRDIGLKRADLYVENRRFVIQQAKELENILMGFHNSRMERTLNVAKATLEASLSIYDALVKRFTARMDGYRAEATVFGERIRGELAKAEIYKTQIEAVGMQVAMNRQLVEVYKAQLDGVKVMVDIYRTQMDAANIRAQIERTKLEAYRALVDGYVAQVQAKTAEFGMYRAGIDGEKAKVDIYEAQVRAFSAQVGAAKIRSDVQVGRLTAEADQARIKLANFQGRISLYDAEVKKQVDNNRVFVDEYRASVDATRGYNEATVAKNKLLIEAINQTTQQNIQISNLAIENAKAQLLAVVEGLKFKAGSKQYASEKYYALLTALVTSIGSLVVQTTAT